MKKTASGVLLVMTLSLTLILSSFVVPVVGITEMAAEAAKKNVEKSNHAEEATTKNVAFGIDDFVKDERDVLASKKIASKHSKLSVTNGPNAVMTEIPLSTTEPIIAGRKSDPFDGFVKEGEIFVDENSVFGGDESDPHFFSKEEDSLQSSSVGDDAFEVIKLEDPLVEVQKGEVIEEIDKESALLAEPFEELGYMPSDYVPPEVTVSAEDFRAEFDAKNQNRTEAEALLGDAKNETSALGAWIYQGAYHHHTNWHRQYSGYHNSGGCSQICGPYGYRWQYRLYRNCPTYYYYHRYRDYNCYSSGWWWWYRSWCSWGRYHYSYSHSRGGSCHGWHYYNWRTVSCNRHACPPPPSPPPPGANPGVPQGAVTRRTVSKMTRLASKMKGEVWYAKLSLKRKKTLRARTKNQKCANILA